MTQQATGWANANRTTPCSAEWPTHAAYKTGGLLQSAVLNGRRADSQQTDIQNIPGTAGKSLAAARNGSASVSQDDIYIHSLFNYESLRFQGNLYKRKDSLKLQFLESTKREHEAVFQQLFIATGSDIVPMPSLWVYSLKAKKNRNAKRE